MNKFHLADYPKANPVFIAADKTSFNLIRHLNGFCYLAANLINEEEFCFCYQREIWVVYSNASYFSFAMELGQVFQSRGANKILVFALSSFYSNQITM